MQVYTGRVDHWSWMILWHISQWSLPSSTTFWILQAFCHILNVWCFLRNHHNIGCIRLSSKCDSIISSIEKRPSSLVLFRNSLQQCLNTLNRQQWVQWTSVWQRMITGVIKPIPMQVSQTMRRTQ
jgi:hypothetical protein